MKKLVVACSVLFLCSCATQNFKLTSGASKTVPNYEGTSHFVFWGIGQEKLIDPKEVCGDKKVAQVATQTSFLNGLFAGITWGIYQPRNYSVYCE